MKKLIACMIFVSLFFASCGVLQDILGENQVLTTSSKVLRGHEDKAAVIKTENLPEKAREFFTLRSREQADDVIPIFQLQEVVNEVSPTTLVFK